MRQFYATGIPCKHCHFHDVPFQTPSKQFILGWYVSYRHSTVSTLVLHAWILKSLFSDASFQNFGAISNPTRAPAWSNLSSHPAARGSFFRPSVLPSNSVPLTGSFKSLLLSKLGQEKNWKYPRWGSLYVASLVSFLLHWTNKNTIYTYRKHAELTDWTIARLRYKDSSFSHVSSLQTPGTANGFCLRFC